MITDLLLDTRLSSSSQIALYGLVHNEFTHGDKGRVVHLLSRLAPRKPRLGKAKKEVEAMGGYLSFIPRGKYVEVHYFLPK